jgi:hypothetical protein
MKYPIQIIFIILLSTLYSCKSFQLAIPNRFREQATQMEVKGWNSYKKLSFGNYRTSKVKRGMFVTSSSQNNSFPLLAREPLIRISDVSAHSVTERKRDRFQYTLSDGNQAVEVFATEGNIDHYIQLNTSYRWLGDFSIGNRGRYSFSAVIVPVSLKDSQVWELAVYNEEHPPVDSLGRKAFFRYPLELGVATNGVDTITIKQIRVTNATTAQGKDTKMPFEVPGGYELRMGDGVVGIINKWNHEVWIYNDRDESTKLVLSAVASSLMLRKINDMK